MTLGDCSSSFEALFVLFAIFCCFYMVIATSACYKLIKETKNREVASIIFLIISILWAINSITATQFYCAYWDISLDWIIANSIMWYTLFFLQMWMLLILYFIKLIKIFNNTPHKLSKPTKITYIIIFIFLFLWWPTIWIIYYFAIPIESQSNAFTALFGSLLLFYALLSISLVVMFINKLIVVYKDVNNAKNKENQIVMNIITKLSVLFIMSISLTFMNIIVNICYFQYYEWPDTNEWLYPFSVFIEFFDASTNCICVILSFKLFSKYYDKLCSNIDNKFHVYFTKLINNDSDKLASVMNQHSNDHELTTVSTTTTTTISPATSNTNTNNNIPNNQTSITSIPTTSSTKTTNV